MSLASRFRPGLSVAMVATLLASVLGSGLSAFAQTHVIAPKNPYPPAKDVELGRQAAQQAERQMPLLNDPGTQAYVARVGARLAESIPPEYQHPEFRYTYKVVDVKDVNAFALPGGFTYVNRGLIETAQNEAQLAGVIAHEISHVALRHGTAQAAKAQKYQTGSVLAQIAGAVIGGGAGQAVGALGQVGIGAAFLRFSREYERQADTLGAQIMARAGYDPHELANMFRILEQLGGGKGPEWLSDHPNPGNRFEAINREAGLLNVKDPERDTADFHRIQARLRDMPRARSMQEIARNNQRYPNSRNPNSRYPDSRDDDRYPSSQDDRQYPDSRDDRQYPDSRDSGRYPNSRDDRQNPDSRDSADSGRLDPRRVSYPSTRYRTYDESGVRISVPDNWREIPGDGNTVTFAPAGGFGSVNGTFVFTHGAQLGLIRAQSRNLRAATDQLINSLTQANRSIRRSGSYQTANLGNLSGLSASLRNFSEVTGEPETLTMLTAFMDSGDLLYVVFVAPENDYARYQNAFQQIARNLDAGR